MSRWARTLVVCSLAASACGASVLPPEPVPVGALPGQPGEIVDLEPASIAADALDAEGLESLLVDAGFVGGSERTFSGTEGGRQRARARVLAFEDHEGSGRYLDWLRDHVDEVIGAAQPVAGLEVPAGAAVWVSVPEPCCPKGQRTFLVAWSDGSHAITLEVAGDGIRKGDAAGYAAELDEALGT